MVYTLSFEGAMKLVPSCVAGSEWAFTTFDKKCDFIIGHIDAALKPVILIASLAQLTNKANKAVRYREIT